MKKKFVVIVMTVLALCLYSGIVTASAAVQCPPHGDFYQLPSSTYGWQSHSHDIFIGEIYGDLIYETCYVYGERITMNVYCGNCKTYIDTYSYVRYYHTHHLCN